MAASAPWPVALVICLSGLWLASPAANTPALVRAQQLVGDDVAGLVEVHDSLEPLRVRDLADVHEHAVHRQGGDLAGLDVLDLERLDHLGAVDLVRHRVPDELELVVGEAALLGDGGRAKLLAPMHQEHLAGELGEEHALLDGRVAAADDGHDAVPVEGAVAGGAPAHAAADELGLAGDAGAARLAAGRQDDRPALHGAGVGLHRPGVGQVVVLEAR